MVLCVFILQILPRSKGTWEIPEFHIQLAESDGEGTESESETGGEGVKSAHQVPTMDEIDSILGAFRREAEVCSYFFLCQFSILKATNVLLSHRQKPGAEKRLSLHQIACHSVLKRPDDLRRLSLLELTSRLWECSRYNDRESTSN